MKYSNEWLDHQIQNGLRPEYIFFWGDKPQKDGRIGKSCFSQWFDRGFTWEDITYPTAEHWMMAEKARLFEDEETLDKILRCKSPGEAKKLGREVLGFEVESWKDKCGDIVMQGNFLKFTQHDDLRAFLVATHGKILVEASPYDNIWGIGMKSGDEGIEDPHNWKGLNLLGYALMEVRDQLLT